MASPSQSLQGMTDISYPEVNIWQTLEARARELMIRHDFREVRTPVVEMAEVYLHSLGDASEIVTKQMYAFETRGGKQVCLRPEGTAGVMRHVASNVQELRDARLYYLGPMFRAERPQAGRKRQFHQLGVECLGEPSPRQDAEVIALQAALFAAWELDGVVFELNTRGSAEDFPRILDGLRELLRPRSSALCEDCQRRLDQNVLRVLDCKVPGCREAVADLPPLTRWMSADSIAYWDEFRRNLDLFGVGFTENPRLVRGLDYYQHSIWEVTCSRLGAQDALAGGGRYRMRVGGQDLPGVGFGIGMERVLMALSPAQNEAFARETRPLIWLVAQNSAARDALLPTLTALRKVGLRARMDLAERGMKAQMKQASRAGARWTLLLGESEMAAGTLQIRDMLSGEQREMSADDCVAALSALTHEAGNEHAVAAERAGE